MKLTLIIASLAATAFAAPAPGEAALEARQDNCFFASECSTLWSGKCDNHCGPRGFSHMTGDKCTWPSKKCCCIVP